MSLEKKTILLVEDDSNDVLLVKRAFRKAQVDANLMLVQDGDEAIAYLSRQNGYGDIDLYPIPSLILLDLKLPRRNGLEVLTWLRQQPILKRLLVVVLTSSSEDPDIIRAYELGINSYLVKPVAFEDLVILVDCINRYWFDLNQKPVLPCR